MPVSMLLVQAKAHNDDLPKRDDNGNCSVQVQVGLAGSRRDINFITIK